MCVPPVGATATRTGFARRESLPAPEAGHDTAGMNRTRVLHALLWGLGAAWMASIVWWAVPGRREPPAPAAAARAATPDPFAPDPELFPPKRPPGPRDWMAIFHEPHQSFADFLAGTPLRRSAQRNVIALQPLGDFDAADMALLDEISEAVAAFFQIEVRLSRTVPLPRDGFRVRAGAPGGKQHLTTDIMDRILRPRLPSDALCFLGITTADLYPASDWSFVFGEARGRLGVYSLARLRPSEHEIPDAAAARPLMRRRALQIVVHEASHILGIEHCVRSECVVNGANTLAESDRAPLEPCPLCLKKLHWSLGFDVQGRYAALRDLYARLGLHDEAAWLARRLQRLRTPASTSGDHVGGRAPPPQAAAATEAQRPDALLPP